MDVHLGFASSSPSSHSHFYVGSMYYDTRLHVARSYTSSADSQSLLFDIILYFVQPSSLRSSSLPSPLYLHFHRPPPYVVFLSSHHKPIPRQPSFLDILCDFPHFRCPSYSFISYIFQLRNSAHPSKHYYFCVLQFIFPCLLQRPCLPRTSVLVLPLFCTPFFDLHVQSAGEFRIQFSILDLLELCYRFKRSIPGLITTHCMAHRLQLLTEKAANLCPQIVKHIAVLNTFAKALKYSPKLCRILECSKEMYGEDAHKVKQVWAWA